MLAVGTGSRQQVRPFSWMQGLAVWAHGSLGPIHLLRSLYVDFPRRALDRPFHTDSWHPGRPQVPPVSTVLCRAQSASQLLSCGQIWPARSLSRTLPSSLSVSPFLLWPFWPFWSLVVRPLGSSSLSLLRSVVSIGPHASWSYFCVWEPSVRFRVESGEHLPLGTPRVTFLRVRNLANFRVLSVERHKRLI